MDLKLWKLILSGGAISLVESTALFIYPLDFWPSLSWPRMVLCIPHIGNGRCLFSFSSEMQGTVLICFICKFILKLCCLYAKRERKRHNANVSANYHFLMKALLSEAVCFRLMLSRMILFFYYFETNQTLNHLCLMIWIFIGYFGRLLSLRWTNVEEVCSPNIGACFVHCSIGLSSRWTHLDQRYYVLHFQQHWH